MGWCCSRRTGRSSSKFMKSRTKDMTHHKRSNTQKTHLMRCQPHNHPPESLAGHRHKRVRVIIKCVEHMVQEAHFL